MRNKLEPPAEWVNPNKVKKKNYKILGIGILTLSLVLLIGTSGYFIKSGKLSLFQNRDNDKTALAETEQSDTQPLDTRPSQETQDAVLEETEERTKEELQKTETLPEPESEPEFQPAQEEKTEQSEALEFEQGPYMLTEEEVYLIDILVGYGWEQIGGEEGDFKTTQEELLVQSIDIEIGSSASQVVHSQMLAEGLFCEGIILERAGNDTHSLYQNPHYFSILLTYEEEILCTYEKFENYVIEAVATSELSDNYGTYLDDYAIDKNITTAWAIGGEERTGESVTLMLDKERTIYGVLILNGYWKSEATYKNNGIVTAFDIYTGSDWQTYAYGFKSNYISDIVGQQAYDVAGIFYDSASADRVTIKVSGVENGEKYEDICISEIIVLAR